jgi:hypothetical protein
MPCSRVAKVITRKELTPCPGWSCLYRVLSPSCCCPSWLPWTGCRGNSDRGPPRSALEAVRKKEQEREGGLHPLLSPTTGGDPMNRQTWIVVGSASLLLLTSAGLELFVRLTLEYSSAATVILALFLAFWSYVLGLGVLLVLSVWWLVRLRRAQVTQSAMSRYAPAEPRSRRLEKPALRDPQCQQGMAPTVPTRSSGERDDGNATNGLSRVA